MPGVLHTEAVLEDLLDLLERQTADLGVEEDDEDPADAADGGVEAKGARGRHALHHGQEGAADDDVGAPARARHEHGADRAHLHREEVGAHPRRVADRDAVEEDEPHDEDEHDDGRRGDLVLAQLESRGVDGNEAEGDGDGEQARRHAPDGADEDLAAAPRVDGHGVDPGHDEVGAGDDETDGDRVGEADEGEEGGGVVHERVEAGHLADDHQAASADQSTEVAGDGVQLLDEVPGRLALGNLLGLLDGARNQADLVADLLGSGVLVDTGNDTLGLIQLAVEDELAGRLRAERQEAGKDDGGNTTKADHVPPSVRDMGEGGSDAVGNNLATGDGHVV